MILINFNKHALRKSVRSHLSANFTVLKACQKASPKVHNQRSLQQHSCNTKYRQHLLRARSTSSIL